MSPTQRVKLAQELHDGIAQDLVGLSYFIDSLIAQSDTSISLRENLRMLRFRITELIERVRNEIFALRAVPLSEESTYKGEMNYELSRIFNELIRNIQAHSTASEITVMVSDNGAGGVVTKTERAGLRGVAERVAELHGTLTIDSGEAGTHVCIKIPRLE